MLHFLSSKRFVPEPGADTLLQFMDELTHASGNSSEPSACECGWFDSSIDLKLGLDVQELSGQALARQI